MERKLKDGDIYALLSVKLAVLSQQESTHMAGQQVTGHSVCLNFANNQTNSLVRKGVFIPVYLSLRKSSE